MKIDRVTITGADNGVSAYSMKELSKKYPFLELGILFSLKSEGQQRYPDKIWRDTLCSIGVERLSAHFCGWYSRQILEKQRFDLIQDLPSNFGRVQINYNFSNSAGYDLAELKYYCKNNPQRAIILQYNKSNKSILDEFILDGLPSNIHFLFDSSGGRGTEIQTIENNFPGHYTGYSGGISPTNINEIFTKISNFHSPDSVWMDMESGVRTNDVFDYEKVLKILNVIQNNIIQQYHTTITKISMSLKKRISDDFVIAFKAKDTDVKSALSFLKAKIQEAEKNNKNVELDDVAVMNVVLSSIKQRKDSISQFKNANRMDLVEKEQAELDAITKYLPEQMTEIEMRLRISEIISTITLEPNKKVKNVGVVMGAMQKKYKGQFDLEKLKLILEELIP